MKGNQMKKEIIDTFVCYITVVIDPGWGELCGCNIANIRCFYHKYDTLDFSNLFMRLPEQIDYLKHNLDFCLYIYHKVNDHIRTDVYLHEAMYDFSNGIKK